MEIPKGIKMNVKYYFMDFVTMYRNSEIVKGVGKIIEKGRRIHNQFISRYYFYSHKILKVKEDDLASLFVFKYPYFISTSNI